MALVLVALFPTAVAGQGLSAPVGSSSQPPANRNALNWQWFEDARFGLTIRWGLYSLLEKDEWVMERDKLPISQYGKLPPRFHASGFDASAWVKTAKAAGARYLTVGAKHHDGFCMFATKLTNYNIVDATPHHTDPIKALAEACHQQRIKLFFYYSLLDWHHPDYFPLGETGQKAGRETKGQWKQYMAYCQGQIRELCTNYGEVGGFWLDGCWDRPDADWQLAATYQLIHELQPRALVANDHATAAIAGEDFRIVKLDPVGDDRMRVRELAAASKLPLQTCWPISAARSHGAAEPGNLSAEQVVHTLVGAAAAGVNLILEVRALPDGSLALDLIKTLDEVGKWLTTYGQSVYGTRRGPIPPQPWGFSTARGPSEHPTEIYLHILPSTENIPVVFDPSISWVPSLFGKKDVLKLTRSGRGLILELPSRDRLPIDTVITLAPRPREAASKGR
jgi:alpha-L-fucosidase